MNQPSPSKKVAWNRGLIVGQKRAFSVEDLAAIEARLIEQCNLHDLALLSFGLDTMLRSSDLLATKVWQIKYTNGPIRTLIARRQRKTRHIVNPVLTPPARRYLMAWLEQSGKDPQDFVFTRTKPKNAKPITRALCGHRESVGVMAWLRQPRVFQPLYPPQQTGAHVLGGVNNAIIHL